MNRRTADILYIGMILFVVAFGIYFFMFLRSESKACLSNPYVYQAGKMEDVYCDCTQDHGRLPTRFTFNDTAIIFHKSFQNFSMKEINLTELYINLNKSGN